MNRIQRNLTGSKISTSSTSLCFFLCRSEKQDGGPGIWFAETFSTSFLKPLKGILLNLTGSNISTSSTKFVFSSRSEKQDDRRGLWLADTFCSFSLKPLKGIQRNLTGSKVLKSSTKVGGFPADRKNKMAALASDRLRRFRLLLWNCWTEFDATWQEARSQHPLPCLCFWVTINKIRWPPRSLIGYDIFNFFFETAQRNSKKLDRKQVLNVF